MRSKKKTESVRNIFTHYWISSPVIWLCVVSFSIRYIHNIIKVSEPIKVVNSFQCVAHSARRKELTTASSAAGFYQQHRCSCLLLFNFFFFFPHHLTRSYFSSDVGEMKNMKHFEAPKMRFKSRFIFSCVKEKFNPLTKWY